MLKPRLLLMLSEQVSDLENDVLAFSQSRDNLDLTMPLFEELRGIVLKDIRNTRKLLKEIESQVKLLQHPRKEI